MARFRKRPVEVEAWRNDEENDAELPSWLDTVETGPDGVLIIRTLEGTMRANRGDWIIRGVAGEIYPCKPEIFEKTYEPV